LTFFCDDDDGGSDDKRRDNDAEGNDFRKRRPAATAG
jgi:hypothetical protein